MATCPDASQRQETLTMQKKVHPMTLSAARQKKAQLIRHQQQIGVAGKSSRALDADAAAQDPCHPN